MLILILRSIKYEQSCAREAGLPWWGILLPLLAVLLLGAGLSFPLFYRCLSVVQGVFFNWYPPKKLKYGKPSLGVSTLT